MIVAAMMAYYVFAIALIGAVAYFTAQRGLRESAVRVEAMLAEMRHETERVRTERVQAETGSSQLEPSVPLRIPDPDKSPELRITIQRHPESDSAVLPRIAARVIEQASRLEQSHGGDGLEYDPAGSIEEPGRLVLRLFPKLADWRVAARLAVVADELNRLVECARENATEKQDVDVRARIERELRPHFPSELIDYVPEATVP